MIRSDWSRCRGIERLEVEMYCARWTTAWIGERALGTCNVVSLRDGLHLFGREERMQRSIFTTVSAC